jgi:putative ABC transport system permease protein
MILNTLKTSFRLMLKAKLDAIVKLLGLGLGLAVCTICAVYVLDELDFNSYYKKNSENIYRVLREYSPEGMDKKILAGTASRLSNLLIDEFPEIEYSARYNRMGMSIKYGEKVYNGTLSTVDSSFFDIFPVELVRGNLNDLFTKPYTLLITEEQADIIFKDEDPIGKSLQYTNFYVEGKFFEVVGIVKTPPRNIFPGYNTITCEKRHLPDWFFDQWALDTEYLPVTTFIKLHKGVSVTDLQKKMQESIPPKMGNEGTVIIKHLLQPFNRMYLYSRADYNLNWGSDIKTLWMFVLLTGVILLIVCINYVNLTIARFAERNKEISIRKANGASKKHLRLVIIIDSILICVLAIPIALLIADFGLGIINSYLNSEYNLDLMHNLKLIVAVILITISTGLISGIYPAIVYCSQTPAFLLNKNKIRKGKSVARQSLVIFQFSISIILIIITIVWLMQYNYYVKKDPGFKADDLLISTILGQDPSLRQNSNKISEVVKENPMIELSGPVHILPGMQRDDFLVKPEGHIEPDFNMVVMAGDHTFNKLFGIEIIQGRDFSETNTSDIKEACLLNEMAVKKLGWEDDPIGRRIEGMDQDMRVIGVVKDFYAAPFDKGIDPTMIMIWDGVYNFMVFKVKKVNHEKAKEYLTEVLTKLSPDSFIGFNTYKDYKENYYNNMKVSSNIFATFSILAIFLACLGLFALSLFSVLKRTKEIGIRKAIGANTKEIAAILLKEILVCVGIAFVISCPIAYYISNLAIKGYSDRIPLSWWIFVLAGLIALFIGILTVLFHTLKAANRNPVDALRYE